MLSIISVDAMEIALSVVTELLTAFSEVRQQVVMLESILKAVEHKGAFQILSHAAFQDSLQQVIMHCCCILMT